jgi:hypothetical protein
LPSPCAFRLCDAMLLVRRALLSFACAQVNGGQRKGTMPREGVDSQRTMQSMSRSERVRRKAQRVAVCAAESDKRRRWLTSCFVSNELMRSARDCCNAMHKDTMSSRVRSGCASSPLGPVRTEGKQAQGAKRQKGRRHHSLRVAMGRSSTNRRHSSPSRSLAAAQTTDRSTRQGRRWQTADGRMATVTPTTTNR